MLTKLGSLRWFVLLLAALGLFGCASKPVDPPRAPAEEQLYRIGRAYVQATYRLGRGPTDFEEIKPNIEGPVSDDLLRSPHDGEPFVIHWGVDFGKLPPGRESPFTVAAYEKNGVDGNRYVLRFPLQILKMDEEAFKKAIFPPGYDRPK
jgi:hypothetical protein